MSSPKMVPAVGVGATVTVDAGSLAELLPTHAAMIQRIIRRVVGRSADIDDLVQSTFAEAFDSLGRYRREASLGGWLGSIAVHVARHHLRPRGRSRCLPLEALLDDDLCPESLIAGVTGADESIDRERLAAKLQLALQHISPPKRAALLLYVMAGHSVAEIAALMNATVTATRSRMFFARRELRALIRADPRFRDLAAVVLPQGVRAKQ